MGRPDTAQGAILLPSILNPRPSVAPAAAAQQTAASPRPGVPDHPNNTSAADSSRRSGTAPAAVENTPASLRGYTRHPENAAACDRDRKALAAVPESFTHSGGYLDTGATASTGGLGRRAVGRGNGANTRVCVNSSTQTARPSMESAEVLLTRVLSGVRPWGMKGAEHPLSPKTKRHGSVTVPAPRLPPPANARGTPPEASMTVTGGKLTSRMHFKPATPQGPVPRQITT